MMRPLLGIYLLFSMTFFFMACDSAHSLEEMKEYDGPIMEVDSIKTVYSDVAKKKIYVTGPKQIELQNENLEYPNGVRVEFFDDKEQVTSILTANFGRYLKDANLYFVSGNVKINNFKEQQSMNSEELWWNPVRHEITTDKYVTITTSSEVLTGTGMTASEDFSTYQILKPTGVFTLK